jgi:hypothetical protein
MMLTEAVGFCVVLAWMSTICQGVCFTTFIAIIAKMTIALAQQAAHRLCEEDDDGGAGTIAPVNSTNLQIQESRHELPKTVLPRRRHHPAGVFQWLQQE